MKLRESIIVLTLIALPGFAAAEFYRYVDQEGKTHYTDDIANIPADQRSHVSQYEDVSHRSSLEEETQITTPEEESREAAVRQPAVLSPTQRAPAVGEDETKTLEKRLKETGTALEQEYQALMEERKQLDEAAKRPMTPAMRRNLVEKVRDFNSRINDYEKRRTAFNGEVETFNADVEDKGQPSEGGTN
jgi:hypothetical protein